MEQTKEVGSFYHMQKSRHTTWQTTKNVKPSSLDIECVHVPRLRISLWLIRSGSAAVPVFRTAGRAFLEAIPGFALKMESFSTLW